MARTPRARGKPDPEGGPPERRFRTFSFHDTLLLAIDDRMGVFLCNRNILGLSQGNVVFSFFEPIHPSVSQLHATNSRLFTNFRHDARIDANEANRSRVARWPLARYRLPGDHRRALRDDRQVA